MDEIQEQVDGIEEESGAVKDLYDLVDMYQVPVNPEDLAVYQVSDGSKSRDSRLFDTFVCVYRHSYMLLKIFSQIFTPASICCVYWDDSL